jgi:hypothetical protein
VYHTGNIKAGTTVGVSLVGNFYKFSDVMCLNKCLINKCIYSRHMKFLSAHMFRLSIGMQHILSISTVSEHNIMNG